MYSYMTPNDSGRSNEGADPEEEGMGTIFDYPMDDEDTFSAEDGKPFPFDGVGQIIMNEQLEQLTVPSARRLMSGLGKTASTLEPDDAMLPPAPEGEKWRLVGPSPLGTGYNWETVPADAPEPDVSQPDGGLMERIKKNKVVSGVVATAIIGGLWWLFKPKGR